MNQIALKETIGKILPDSYATSAPKRPKFEAQSADHQPDLPTCFIDNISYNPKEDEFLRDYQKQLMTEFIAKWPTQTHAGLEMPTGSGKTAMMTQIVSLAIKSGVERIVIILPTQNLLEETQVKIPAYAKKHPQLGITETLAHYYSKTRSEQKDSISKEKIILSTYQSLKKLLPKLTLNKNSLVIFDEAHRCKGKETKIHVEGLACPVIGLSASLYLYPESKLPITSIVKYSIDDAVSDEAISPIQCIDFDLSHQPDIKELRKRIGIKGNTLTQEQRDQIGEFLAKQKGIDVTVTQLLQQLIIAKDPSAKIMVFTRTILHADSLREIFQHIGIGAVCYHGQIKPKALLEQAMTEFKTVGSKAQVMISCGMLDEGTDFPAVKTVVDYDIAIKQARLMQQRMGRATRVHKGQSAVYIRIAILGSKQLSPRSAGILNPKKPASHIGCSSDQLLFHPEYNESKHPEGLRVVSIDGLPKPMSIKVKFSKKGTNAKGKQSFYTILQLDKHPIKDPDELPNSVAATAETGLMEASAMLAEIDQENKSYRLLYRLC
ncbi:DEAD/DEAH box helicase family protein [Candidatus Comchoanobacter bicostacola]|uniref:DEAD/DEAH box helicase family protein n=1 Tax=Candidatus Comchoanobacter bicostacola TaxID=2919598 RepID=A0ABY5DIW2_9GAMM|nr:DEAD/DEAH box helicase family protein [Candidatus Comchoanobacter bicostacola]UTC24200.1 DEAD/DEAH box helicase family protein [Candidatus Comchoanobacter bicostacola]